jgi:dihydropteroate synthase
MGILNVTPDSFFDGGRHVGEHAALARARQMIDEGADVLDIGGESTRPGADAVPEDEELRRVLPVVRRLRAEGLAVPLSIDTSRARVADRCLEAGADIVNDVTGGVREPEILDVVARRGAAIVLMHTRGTPQTMGKLCQYDDLVEDLRAELLERCDAADRAGVPRERQAIDPGIGFAKDAWQSAELVARGGALQSLGRAVLVGASRKSYLGRAFGLEGEDRLWGSVAAHLWAARAGAALLRVHDVRPTVAALRVEWGLRGLLR